MFTFGQNRYGRTGLAPREKEKEPSKRFLMWKEDRDIEKKKVEEQREKYEMSESCSDSLGSSDYSSAFESFNGIDPLSI